MCCIFKEKKRGRKGFARRRKRGAADQRSSVKRRRDADQKTPKFAKDYSHVWVLCVHGRLMLFFEKG